MYRLSLAICFGAMLVWTLGCASPPNGAAPAAGVKGTVKMDGKPVAAGEIHFGVAGFPPRVLQIAGGEFSGEAPIGKNAVEVYVFVEEGPSEKYPTIPNKRNVVPEKYWGPKSVLNGTVNATGISEFKFDISTK